MLEEIQRRNFTESTTRAYLRIIEDFARYFHRPPDQLGSEHIREYVAHLFRDKKLSDNSVNQTVGALRFFFVKMLKQPWRVDETPYPKKRMRLPVILSRDEVARLIECASNEFHRTILMTLYATGVRRSELVHLKLTDVDSERMVLHIHNGKGRKDRDVVLSPHLLHELRQHYRRLTRKPATWLFPGGQWHTGDSDNSEFRRDPFKRAPGAGEHLAFMANFSGSLRAVASTVYPGRRAGSIIAGFSSFPARRR